jgi:hypothetical protein
MEYPSIFHYYPLQYFLIWKNIFKKKFNISENNIISVKLVKVLS